MTAFKKLLPTSVSSASAVSLLWHLLGVIKCDSRRRGR